MIGSSLAEYALSMGARVTAIVRPNSKNISHLKKHDNLNLIECPVSEYNSLDIGSDYDGFFHLAWDKTFGEARDDTYIQNNNIKYTIDAVELASRSGCSFFVGAGSQAEYGTTDCPLNEDTPVNPKSGYGIAKYAAGKLSRIQCEKHGIRHCWTRILSVYGETDADHTLIKYCINSMLKGEHVSLTKCDQMWDYLYSGDAAAALYSIGENGVDGRTYCLGSGNIRPLRDYINIIRDEINPAYQIGFGEREYYPHQAMYLCADITNLVNDTGYCPTTSFEDGIKKTVEYCRRNEI